MDDAAKAGLKGKQGPWTQYPKRMMQMRARSWALRDVFPDVLRGMPVAEEVMDYAPTERDITPPKTAERVTGPPPTRLTSLKEPAFVARGDRGRKKMQKPSLPWSPVRAC